MERTNWARYCIPRGRLVHYDEHGFPRDPKILRKYLQPAAVRLTKVLQRSWVVLTGEPGIGKSDAIRQLVAQAPDQERLFVDLAERIDPQQDLYMTRQFKAWQAGRPLHLFIDSLDEDPDVLAGLLPRLRKPEGRGELRLRIACRTGAVPELLQTAQPELWGDPKGLRVYELMPLCRRDIEQHVGTDAAGFLARVVERGAAPLASRPVCLQFFRQEYANTRDLPDRRWKLYESGCRHLCKENNPVRTLTGRPDILSSDRRMELASRIAAMCVLTGRSLVQRLSDRDVQIGGAVTWKELCEDLGELAAIRDTVQGTSLFSGRGQACVGFAHASYASFLAARYMRQHGYRLADLLAQCAGPGYRGPVPLAVRDVAGWLASKDAETRDWLLDHDPRVLLTSDLQHAPAELLEHLVRRLLELADNRTLPVDDLQVHYQKLQYPGLTEQLQEWIADDKNYVLARAMAIEIAGACGCQSLAPVLLRIVLSPQEGGRLRGDAFDELRRMGEPSTLYELLPLLVEPGLSVPNAFVRGSLMRKLWPGHLSSDQLLLILDAAHARREDDLDGFIEQDLVPRADRELMIRMIERVQRGVAAGNRRYATGLLRELLIRRGLDSLDDAGMLAAIAGLVAACMSLREDPFLFRRKRSGGSMLAVVDVASRRALAAAVMAAVGGQVKDHMARLWNLLIPGDIAWMIQQYLDAADPKVRARWQRLVADMVREHPPGAESKAEALLAVAGEQSTEFREALVCWFGPVTWGLGDVSKEADRMREAYEERRRVSVMRHRHERQQRMRRDVGTRLSRLVSTIEAAEPEPGSIKKLVELLMYFEDDARFYPEDVREMTAWARLPEATRTHWGALVEAFLSRHPLREHETERWGVHYRLLRFMLAVDPDWLGRQADALWQGWTLAIVAHIDQEDESQGRLLTLAYRNSASLVRWCLAVKVTRAANEHELARVWRAARQVLGDDVAAFMADKLADEGYPANTYGALLSFLLTAGWPGVEARLYELVAADPQDLRRRDRALAAAAVLWEEMPDFGWPVLGPRFAADPVFGEEVVQRVVRRGWSTGDTWGGRVEDALVAAYTWMLQRFPETADPELTNRMGETDRYKIAQLRHSMLVGLQSRGTPSVLAAIEALRQQFPEEPSLPRAVGYARDQVASAAWRWLGPRRVLRLQRVRQGTPPLESLLFILTIPELWSVAVELDQKLADDIPPQASKAKIVEIMAAGIVRRRETDRVCGRVQEITDEADIEIARILADLAP